MSLTASQIWIDVLLSAGVPVEVCKVKAKDAIASQQAMDRLMRRKAANEAKDSRIQGTAKREKDFDEMDEAELLGWGNGNDDDDGEAEDEWTYEDGNEGKEEGHWQGSRKKPRL